MGGAAILINIRSVRLTVNHISLSAQSVIHALCNGKGASVRAVKPNPHILKGTGRQGNQITDITVSSCRIVHRKPDILSLGKRKLIRLPVDVSLNLLLDFCLNLMPFPADNLNTVVIERVMACGNHNAAVKIIRPGHIGNAGRGGYMEKVCVRP